MALARLLTPTPDYILRYLPTNQDLPMVSSRKSSAPIRWLGRIGLGLIGLIALAVVIGSIYEFVGRRRALREFPVAGKLVDIGGRQMQIDCRGTGSPIVVFEAGLDINGSLA